jgi:hypothetical protein
MYFPVVDNHGDVQSGITARFYEPGTTTPISETIYALPSGGSELSQPVSFESGVVDAYLAKPKRVRVGIQPTGQAEFYLEDHEFLPAGNNLVVTTGTVITILGNPTAAGQTLISNDDGTFHWGLLVTGSGGSGGGEVIGTETNPFNTIAFFEDTDGNVWQLSVDTDGHVQTSPNV